MTTQINIDSKSQLAKLIATENIEVQHNAVKTASFDVKNRILTLPIFKVQSKDVYDMLIAHECAHALYTPENGWKEISDDDELRAYCNVLEDCRIDKLIQSKYPGVTRNYFNGFDILYKQDFFGIKDKDVSIDLMLIDKINLFYKSSKRMNINFTGEEKDWLSVVDDIKTWEDVVKVAKLMLNWQKKQIEKLKKLPNFDNLQLVENYNLDDNLDSDNNVNTKADKSSDKESSKNKSSDKTSSNNLDNDNIEDKKDDAKETLDKLHKVGNGNGPVGGGKGKLIAITDQSFESKKQQLLDTSSKYLYMNIPEPNFNNCLISYDTFINDFRKHIQVEIKKYERCNRYYNWLKTDFKKFKNDNKKTVMYLVKEFEMKKAATSYKRASTDKTGVIDPLKLKNYKFSDDLFKRLTILPNEKNHGMMMLLDWSGSMCDVLKNTVDQLINLVYFCQKIQIPFEVYIFSSETSDKNNAFDYDDKKVNKTFNSFNFKHGDIALDNFGLINIASHRMKKSILDESMMYLYSMGLYYSDRYSYARRFNDIDGYMSRGENFGMPYKYHLGNTPLNEALVVCNKLISIFKKKYNIEKMTFITLTDGGANSYRGVISTFEDGSLFNSTKDYGQIVLKTKKKKYTNNNTNFYRSGVTGTLLDIIRKEHNINTIGFHILKNLRGWEAERYLGSNHSLSPEDLKKREQLRKDKVAVIKDQPGYDEFYILNKKHLNVENADLSDIKSDKTKDIRKAFSKSMKGRITSRVLLNKFIEKVA